MIVHTKLDFKKYLNIVFKLSHTFLISSIGGLVGFAVGISLYMSTPEAGDLLFSDGSFFVTLGALFLFGIPGLSYYGARRNFNTSPRLTESITYEFTMETLKITGESFSSEMNWDKVYKVKELKDWILIYQNRMVANLIPKESFDNNLSEFKSIVEKHSSIKNKLKKKRR